MAICQRFVLQLAVTLLHPTRQMLHTDLRARKICVNTILPTFNDKQIKIAALSGAGHLHLAWKQKRKRSYLLKTPACVPQLLCVFLWQLDALFQWQVKCGIFRDSEETAKSSLDCSVPLSPLLSLPVSLCKSGYPVHLLLLRCFIWRREQSF